MYKNQLQELAQRSCYNMPSYSCMKEGPDHAPKFKAIVNFNGEVFESPGYFATLRHAEHAAAEIALRDLQTRTNPHSLSKILDESGVCKNLLQENAQRAGVPLPVYSTRKSGPGHQPVFTCTVEVAAMQFTGDAAKTKKQAEKNAALSAWSALRKKAGRRSAAPIEDSDVTDEQEQKLIADILKNNLSEKQPIKSSPAALAENHHHRAGVSPALLPSAPLYTRQRPASTGVSIGPSPALPSSSGLLYTRHHGRVHPTEKDEQASAMPPSSGGPMYKPRHINAHWVGQQNVMPGQMGPGDSSSGHMPHPEHRLASNLYGITQAHSSPHVHSHNAMAVRNSLPVGAVKHDHSLPAFPTQAPASHALPGMHGLHTPRSSQVLQPSSGTSSHTNLAIRPGMAYQPRFPRSQYQQAAPACTAAPWAHEQQSLPQAGHSAPQMWREQGASWGQQGVGQVPASGLTMGVPAVMATGGRPTMHAACAEEEDDNQQVEHTTRLMLSHLCLE